MNINEIVATLEDLAVKVEWLEHRLEALEAAKE